MPGDSEWYIEDATWALASLGYVPTGPFRWSDDLGGGFFGWEVEVVEAADDYALGGVEGSAS